MSLKKKLGKIFFQLKMKIFSHIFFQIFSKIFFQKFFFQKNFFFQKKFQKFVGNFLKLSHKNAKSRYFGKIYGLPKPPEAIFSHHQNHLEAKIEKGPPTTSLVSLQPHLLHFYLTNFSKKKRFFCLYQRCCRGGGLFQFLPPGGFRDGKKWPQVVLVTHKFSRKIDFLHF